MKLGVCYMVFDGEELLPFALKAIRRNADFIAVTYQTTSYYGNPNDTDITQVVINLQNEGLIDRAIHFEPDLSLKPKENELKLRNLGLAASRQAGCTHHISADVDEFYDGEQLEYAKQEIIGYDYSMIWHEIYFKKPTFLVTPPTKISCTFMHPVENEYHMDEFPFRIEPTRRLRGDRYKIFERHEIVTHHMSYVRRDILKKFRNSTNGRFLDKFFKVYNKYEVGERVQLLPDYMNRRTIQVADRFNMGEIWEQHRLRE